MRPKKRVLLIDVNELRRGDYSFTLRVARFDVQAVGSAAAARAEAVAWNPDVILAILPADGLGLGKLLNELHALNPYLPSLVLAATASAELAAVPASGTAVNAPMADVIDRLRIMSARKRGPRKGSHRLPVAAAEAVPAERLLA